MLKWFRRKKQEKPEELKEERVSEETGLWQKFRRGLSRTRERLKDSLGELFEVDRLVDQNFLEEVEEIFEVHLPVPFGVDRDGQLSLYYQGVGTYGNKLKRLLNAGLALKDPGRIITEALEDLENYKREGDVISVFGFSRGAALARIFCSRVSKKYAESVRIRFLGCFDTFITLHLTQS